MRVLIVAAIMACAAAVGAFAQDSLPLAERRALATNQTETYPNQPGAIRQAAGFDVPVDVQWDKIAPPGKAELFNKDDYFTVVIFTLIEALKHVGSDMAGIAAMKENPKGIVITVDPATAPASNNPNGLTFAAGILTVNWTPGENINDMKPRVEAIQTLLESKL